MEKNKAYDFPDEFYDFAFMPKFSDNMEYLKSMAEDEDWDYQNTGHSENHPILRNYIKYTYQRIAKEKKISVTSDESFCCWNTGLVTKNQEPIFIVFERNKLPDQRQYWHFSKFCRKGEWDLNKFSTVPEMAHYFDEPSVLVFDTRKELRINAEHIISENISRFPSALQHMDIYGLQNLVKGAIDSVKERVKGTIRRLFLSIIKEKFNYFYLFHY